MVIKQKSFNIQLISEEFLSKIDYIRDNQYLIIEPSRNKMHLSESTLMCENCLVVYLTA